MLNQNIFIQFGNLRLEKNRIQAYQIVKGTAVIKTARIVNIDPNSEEGRQLLEDFNFGKNARAVGAGIASGAAGIVGGGVVGLVSFAAISAMTGGAAFVLGGAIAAGSTILGVKGSLNKSEKKKKDLFKKNEEKEVDTSILQIVLKDGEVEEITEGHTGYSTTNFASGNTHLTKKHRKKNETLQFQANECGFDIYEKCKELDSIFGVSSD